MDEKQRWEHKRFTVTLTRVDVAYGAPIPYSMGVPVFEARRGESISDRADRMRRVEAEREARVPIVYDVVASLLSDASCYESARDFADFCAEFDYSTDSIKARDCYHACGETNKRIRAFFGPLFDEFQKAAEGY